MILDYIFFRCCCFNIQVDVNGYLDILDEEVIIILKLIDQSFGKVHEMSNQNLIFRSIKRLIRKTIKLVSSNVLISTFKTVSYWWRQYEMAVKIYFSGIRIVVVNGCLMLQNSYELQLIPLMVQDAMFSSKIPHFWSGREVRTSCFCTAFSPNLYIPKHLQMIITSYQSDI